MLRVLTLFLQVHLLLLLWILLIVPVFEGRTDVAVFNVDEALTIVLAVSPSCRRLMQLRREFLRLLIASHATAMNRAKFTVEVHADDGTLLSHDQVLQLLCRLHGVFHDVVDQWIRIRWPIVEHGCWYVVIDEKLILHLFSNSNN